MDQRPRASRFLEQTLLWNFLIHLAAMGTMASILLPGLPGGPLKSDAARIGYIASNPTMWSLGWIPWHLCALIDLITGIALISTRWVPRLPAILTTFITAAAVALEQTGELSWAYRGAGLAQKAIETGDFTNYLAFEKWVYHYTVVLGASLYMVMALGWTWCFAAAGTWNRALSWLTPFAWGILSVGSIGLLLPEAARPSTAVTGLTNGIGFVLLEVWLWLVCEQVLRRSRPDEKHGRMAPWRHPRKGPIAWLITQAANSRTLRAFCEWLPAVACRSDVTNVIYVNYLVEADRLTSLVPEGFELQRLGPSGEYSLLTFLTYKHGHFGPAAIGRLRRLCPSPAHSNWRVYVREFSRGTASVYFFTNAIGSTLYALGARLFSEGMPMHLPSKAEVTANADGSFRVVLDPGLGSSPDFEGTFQLGKPELPGPPWTDAFGSYHDFLAYCVPQDRAFSTQVWYQRISRQEIRLDIPLESCQALTGEVRSNSAEAIVGAGRVAVCFHVPSVAFRFEGEWHEPLATMGP
jgi:hypothetical protein